MDPADAAGRRRTQAWLGPPIGPPAGQAQPRSLRWEPTDVGVPPVQAANSTGPQAHNQPGSQRYPREIIADRYQLVRPLGQGASTQIWAASHIELGRAVALEFLCGATIEHTEWMLSEARAVAQIRHPHAVEYTDFGRISSGQPFLVMEMLVGETLAQELARRGVIAWARAVTITRQVAEAIGAGYAQGVVHRALRPSNVFLLDTHGGGGGGDDFVKVVEFGLSRARYGEAAVGYASPEQWRGEPLDARSDVYTIGCLLYTMITGDPPSSHHAPRPLRERAPRQFIPDELEALVARCLAPSPSDRFADTRELAASLARLAHFGAVATAGGAPMQAASAQPMGFAGRPAPRSPSELTDSTKPAPRRSPPSGAARSSGPANAGMSTPTLVAVTLAGLVAVLGFGIGMYWLVERLITPEPQAASVVDSGSGSGSGSKTAPLNASVTPRIPSTGGPDPASPIPGDSVAPALGPSEPAAAEPAPKLDPEPAATQPAKPAPKKVAPKPAAEPKPSPGESKVSDPPEPESEPVPAPTPKPKPKPKKPTIQPDSKAKDQIGHDELLDPWG